MSRSLKTQRRCGKEEHSETNNYLYLKVINKIITADIKSSTIDQRKLNKVYSLLNKKNVGNRPADTTLRMKSRKSRDCQI